MPNCRMAKKSAVTPSNSAMRHNPAYGIMTELMQRGAVPVDRLEIGLRGWDLHIVFSRRIEGTIAANAKRDAGGLISASTVGSIRPGGGGGAAVEISSGRDSH